MSPIARVLVANRGEIAVRIIRACRSLGLETVAVVSEADRESTAARLATRAVCIGPARASDSYLKREALIAAALGTGADALHPGYGFLSEQPELAEACREHGLAFVGPSPEALRQMGNKIAARETARAFGVPVTPGSDRVPNLPAAKAVAAQIGFPLILKAAAGGGGKGMKIVRTVGELTEAFDVASSEALAAFGDGTLYVERYVPDARHVEVQVLADDFGHVLHLGERDCSSQRRHQKIIEEAPAPALAEEVREEIRSAAVRLARGIGYRNAGTVEFIFDRDRGEFYFMEMNTRIQVEHPVSEMVSGVDIVREQLRIAAGEPLALGQEEVRLSGHAVECRINAECPARGFQPSPGRITAWVAPEGPGIRVDTHVFPGYVVPPYYDSLLAKLITHGRDRGEALDRMRAALGAFIASGVETTIPFLRYLLDDPDFLAGRMNTGWVEARMSSYSPAGG